MLPHRAAIVFAVILLVLLLLTACTSNQIIATLTGVVSAVEVVFPVIAQAANLPPELTAQISKYLEAVAGATGQASDILASSDTPTVKALKITTLFAGIAVPNLPPGTPQNIARAVQTVVQAVAKFLENFAGSQGAREFGQGKPSVVNDSDRAKLADIKARAILAAGRARQLK